MDSQGLHRCVIGPRARGRKRAHAALGFRQTAWVELQEALLAHPRSAEAIAMHSSPHGQKYEVRGILHGPNGREAFIVTVWIVLTGDEIPHLVTAYPGDAP